MAVRLPRSLIVLAALAAGLAGVAVSSATRQDTVLPTVYFKYAVNCTFTVTNDSGATVTSMAPGSYNVQITTPSDFANEKDRAGLPPTDFSDCKGTPDFTLTGPGVNIETTLDDGSNDYEQFAATFQASSTYVAVDNNQPSVARATFTTNANGTPTTPSSTAFENPTSTTTSNQTPVVGQHPSSTPLVLRGTLVGAVSAAGKLSLTLKGKGVTSLKAGRYHVTITDKSKRGGFTLQERNHAAKTLTSTPFRGKHTATIAMTAGQWFFYSSLIGKKTFFFVVAT